MSEGKELTWEEIIELYGLSDHIRDLLEHYYDFPPFSREELEKRLNALSKEYPELGWITKEHNVLSFRLEEGGLYLLLELDNMGWVLHLPKRPRAYDPYELRVDLATVLFSDEDILFSDGIGQHGYEIPEDFSEEEYDDSVNKDLEKWEDYEEKIELTALVIIKRGVVREEKCYVNIPHYHYFKDLEVILITSWINLYRLLLAAPHLIEFI